MAVGESVSETKWLTVREAAQVLKVHEDAIREWCNKGILKCYRINGRGGGYVNEDSVKALIRPCDRDHELLKKS